MKRTKDVQVTKKDLYDVHLLTSEAPRRNRHYNGECLNNVGCQYDSREAFQMRHREHKKAPKGIYTYYKSSSYTDIGVGSTKAIHKRKVKKIYVPETDEIGVGSSCLSSYIFTRKTKYDRRHKHDYKKRTMTKCVGSILLNNNTANADDCNDEKVYRSGATSPKISEKTNIEVGSNTINKYLSSTATQVNSEYIRGYEKTAEKPSPETPRGLLKSSESPKKMASISRTENPQSIVPKRVMIDKASSSDSLLEQIHDFDLSNDPKGSRVIEDTKENKLDKEYMRIFSSRIKETVPSFEKTVPDLKSTSLLRRRFEAFKRGFVKKDSVIASKESSPSKKDVSISSDPPSLVERSYCDVHPSQPHQDTSQTTTKDYKESAGSSHGEGVKSMFKLWGEKFNLEEKAYKPKSSPKYSYNAAIKMIKEPCAPKQPNKKEKNSKKKTGHNFFSFIRKNKDKNKQAKPNNGLTTGRCEVNNGYAVQIPSSQQTYISEGPLKESRSSITDGQCSGEAQPPYGYDSITRKSWMKRFLTQPELSSNSVKVRWNNFKTTKSSSTIFELLESIYRHTDLLLNSRSAVSLVTSTHYKSKPQVNFNQNIEAWMIPHLVQEKRIPIAPEYINKRDKKKNIQVQISDRKWFIDKSKAFAHKIEVVLHSKNMSNLKKDSSSDYLRIDIPKGFFSDSSYESREHYQTSNSEEVYKIVEYENSESNRALYINTLNTADRNDLKVTVSIKSGKESKIIEKVIKTPPVHRDVVIQGSNVYIPKKCNVIGVGIITQRDLRDARDPVLTFTDDYSDYSEQTLTNYHKKCEFAESYLQNYYKNWTPLGIELYSWCVSDSIVQCASDDSRSCINNQGDGSKSCPNMYDNYLASAVYNSCPKASNEECSDEETPKKFFLFKFKSKENEDKRVLPKDSFAVCRKRQLYAKISNRAQWNNNLGSSVSTTSLHDKCTHGSSREKAKHKKNAHKCKVEKHVLIPTCAEPPKKSPVEKGTAARCKKPGSPKPVLSYKRPKMPCKSSEDITIDNKRGISPSNSCLENRDHQNYSCSTPMTPPVCLTPTCGSFVKSPCSSHTSIIRRSKTSSTENFMLKSKSTVPKYSMTSSSSSNCCSKCKSSYITHATSCLAVPEPTQTNPCPPKPVQRNQNPERPFDEDKNQCPTASPCASLRKQPTSKVSASNQSITIKLEKEGSSCDTNKKTDGVLIKVQDASGKTLYERRDFMTQNCNNIKRSSSLIGEVYNLDRTITPSSEPTCEMLKKNDVCDQEVEAVESTSSVINLIEINFDLKVKPGDKNAEINLGSEGKCHYANPTFKNVAIPTSPTYFATKDDGTVVSGDSASQNNVNIRIVIKNYKAKSEKNTKQSVIDNDTKENQKYVVSHNSVSTGFSGMFDEPNYNIPIVQRATLGVSPLTSEKIKMDYKHIDNVTQESIKPVLSIKTVKKSFIEGHTIRDIEVKSIDKNEIQKDTKEEHKGKDKEIRETPFIKESIVKDICVTTIDNDKKQNIDIEDNMKQCKETEELLQIKSFGHAHMVDEMNISDYVNENTDNTSVEIIKKPSSKLEKKKMLKKVFEKVATNQAKNKKRIKQLLKIILTSDSSDHEMTIASNDLVNDVTYTSLKPNYFRDTDSMSNYYTRESTNDFNSDNEPKNKPVTVQSTDSCNSFEKVHQKCTSCDCSPLAEKIKLAGTGCRCCCARDNNKIDEETCCDIRNDQDLLLLNYKAQKASKLTNQEVANAKSSGHNLPKEIIVDVKKDEIDVKIKKVKRQMSPITGIDDNGCANEKNIYVAATKEENICNVDEKFKKRRKHHKESFNYFMQSDILQSYETKKAVLEIYAEKTITEDGEHIVAKLPKFKFDKEREVNYEKLFSKYNSVCKKDYVMMS